LRFLSKMLSYWSSIQNKRDAKRLLKLIEDESYEFPMRPINEIVREAHETYKIGKNITAKVRSKHEIQQAKIEASLRLQKMVEQSEFRSRAKWLTAGNTPDEATVKYLKELLDEKKRYDN
jgi:hypothetical protein